MCNFGHVWGAAYGPTSTQILNLKGSSHGGGLRATINIKPEDRERYYHVHINGIWLRNEYFGIEDKVCNFPVSRPDGSIDSFWMEDAGLYPTFDPEDLPFISWKAKEQDGLTSNNFNLTWNNTGRYVTTNPIGDTQLSEIVITGAQRGVNLDIVQNFKQRGRVYYTITRNLYGEVFVRWWSSKKLLAEGVVSISGTGVSTGTDSTPYLIQCNAVNDSGLSVECVLSYVRDVPRGQAYVDCQFTKIFEIHYSREPLVFPRLPEDTMPDDGGDVYTYIQTGLEPGLWNVAIVGVDDEGDKSDPVVPDTSPIEIKDLPGAPTITSVEKISGGGHVGYEVPGGGPMGDLPMCGGGGLLDPVVYRVHFTEGDEATSHVVYYSDVNDVVNDGTLSGPEPIETTDNFADIEIANFIQTNTEPAYIELKAVCDNAVLTCNIAFANIGTTDEQLFLAAFDVLRGTVEAAVDAFADSLGYNLFSYKNNLNQKGYSAALSIASFTNPVYTVQEFQQQAGIMYGEYLQLLGENLTGDPYTYSLSNGAIAGSSLGGESIGVSVDGTLGTLVPFNKENLLEVAKPFLKKNIVRIMVRAVKEGTYGRAEEQNNRIYELEIDNDGEIVDVAPNDAVILDQPTITRAGAGYNVTAKGLVIEDNTEADAAYLDFYLVPVADDYDFGIPTVSVAVPDAFSGVRSAAFPTVNVSAGTYRMTVKARSSTGQRSNGYTEIIFDLNTKSPITPGNVTLDVIRTKGK